MVRMRLDEAMRSCGHVDTGGEDKENKEGNDDDSGTNTEWGMALALDRDLLRGTSSRCATFASNPLIDRSRHENSDVFEIMNMEIWVGAIICMRRPRSCLFPHFSPLILSFACAHFLRVCTSHFRPSLHA